LSVFDSDRNHDQRTNNKIKILDRPLQISSLEEQQRIAERPPPAWFASEKKITTVVFLCIMCFRLGKMYTQLVVPRIVLTWKPREKSPNFVIGPGKEGFESHTFRHSVW